MASIARVKRQVVSLSTDPLFAEISERFSAEIREQVGITWPSPYVFSMKHEIHSRIGLM